MIKMARDISNAELKETLIGMKESFKQSNDSLKEFIQQNNVNIQSLNDNQVFHTKELEKLNDKLEFWARLTNKIVPKIIWLLIILVAIILVMAGYNFVWNAII